MVQVVFLFGEKLPDIDIFLLQFLCTALHHLPVILELLLGILDRIQILQKDRLIIPHGIVQCVSADLSHGFLNLLQLYPQQIKDIFDLVHRLVIALLFQMHLKDHLVDGQLHVIFNFQSGEQQIVSIIGQIIRSAPEFLIHIDNAVGHIADVHVLIFVFFKIKAVKVHGLSLVGQDDIDNEIPQLFAVVVIQIFMKMLYVDGIDISPDVIHGAAFLPKRLLHDIEKDRKDDVDLLRTSRETILLPGSLLDAVLNQHKMKPDAFHAAGKMFQKIVLHGISFLVSICLDAIRGPGYRPTQNRRL